MSTILEQAIKVKDENFKTNQLSTIAILLESKERLTIRYHKELAQAEGQIEAVEKATHIDEIQENRGRYLNTH